MSIFVTLGEESALDDIYRQMNKANVHAYDFHPTGETTSPLTDEEHKANIRRGIKHCLRGDVFQIVIARRFIQKYEGDDFKLYRALRSINPSPYLFYFDLGGFRLFGSSPETHCRIQGRSAYIDPIAGTTKRTGDAELERFAYPNGSSDCKVTVSLGDANEVVAVAGSKLSCQKTCCEFVRIVPSVNDIAGVCNRLPPKNNKSISEKSTYGCFSFAQKFQEHLNLLQKSIKKVCGLWKNEAVFYNGKEFKTRGETDVS